MPDGHGVPFLDVGASYRELREELDEAIAGVLAGGRYVLGPEVTAFEAEFASYVEATHAVGTGNGLDALTLALRAVGVGPGDEVIVPSNTFIATWLAVSAIGAVPVPVDPGLGGFTIDAGAIEDAITASTRAVIPVHLYGRPADLDPILALARRHDLRVVEDAAQAHGARYRGRRIGAHGDAVCWSFYPGKNLGAFGDGGAVTTNRDEVADRVRRIANYGSDRKYVHEVQGVNSRLDELQAAVLRVKLRHLDEWNERRRSIAANYRRALGAIESLRLPAVSQGPGDVEPVWHLFVVQSPRRDALAAGLTSRGVQTVIHYPIPPHRQRAYADSPVGALELPQADRLAADVLSLPMGPHLSPDQVNAVTYAVGTTLAAGAP